MKIREGITIGAGLLGASGCVILWVEIEDHLLASEILKFHSIAILVSGGKRGCGGTFCRVAHRKSVLKRPGFERENLWAVN